MTADIIFNDVKRITNIHSLSFQDGKIQAFLTCYQDEIVNLVKDYQTVEDITPEDITLAVYDRIENILVDTKFIEMKDKHFFNN